MRVSMIFNALMSITVVLLTTEIGWVLTLWWQLPTFPRILVRPSLTA